MNKTQLPKTLAEVTEIQAEDQAIADFRKQAQKHFNRKDIFVIVNSETGEMEAMPLGSQAEAPQPSKADKPSNAPHTNQTAATGPQNAPYVPPVAERLRNYATAYAFDMVRGTHELAIYRDAIRRAQQERLRHDFRISQ